ncbi:MAG: UDP-3-O-acyl-N-acetylglucosamine deacetylase [Proteobacteria bacterium]|nr:UDP-3-O-acyl-N-acetylglucosamine deacetylase [Pseudomonadota bacterium]MBW3617839.1 UDP-3-O-acyl-N-acetylglucosamine deacetylase [Pseudomonadota bacterium]
MILDARQHTVAGSAICAGVGMHTGQRVRLAIRPAPADGGIVFVRSDLPGSGGNDNRVPVSAEAVVATRLGTVIANAAGVTVSTIEHLMAALAALGVDNALVEVDGPEVPIMDGSALPFVELLDRAGRRAQAAPRRVIEVLRPVTVSEGGKHASLLPAERFEVDFEIRFASAAIGRQRVVTAADEAGFRRELADCRTFGFLHEVESLRAAGLARGGSLANAVVIDGDRVLNPEGLRRPDEFVRHKALDAVGDLYVLGAPILGRFESSCGGHGLNNQLCRALLAQPDAWRFGLSTPELAEAV